MVQNSKTFKRTADDLFNQGVDDPRQRVTFHIFRRTFASWPVMEDVDPYRVKEMPGHKDLTMTQQHSYLAPDSLRGAVNILEEALKSKKRGQRRRGDFNRAGSLIFLDRYYRKDFFLSTAVPKFLNPP